MLYGKHFCRIASKISRWRWDKLLAKEKIWKQSKWVISKFDPISFMVWFRQKFTNDMVTCVSIERHWYYMYVCSGKGSNAWSPGWGSRDTQDTTSSQWPNQGWGSRSLAQPFRCVWGMRRCLLLETHSCYVVLYHPNYVDVYGMV